jgi:hypothetical protein
MDLTIVLEGMKCLANIPTNHLKVTYPGMFSGIELQVKNILDKTTLKLYYPS